MSGEIIIDLAGFLPARRMLDRLSRLQTSRLLEVLGSELESQTRRRLATEKTSPDGAPWAPWSKDYAEQRPNKGGLLELSGGLIDSIAYEVGEDAVTVGSNLVYALVHQEGTVVGPLREGQGRTPARPYLGVSDANLADLGELVLEFLAKEAAA